MIKKDKNRYNHFNSIFLGISLAVMLLSAGISVASAAPITFSNIEVTAIRNTSVVIQWDTDMAATGQIEYGLNTNYGSLTEVKGLSYWHPIEITGLTPGTTYHYRIRAKDYKGEETISGDLSFTTRTTAELENVIRAARINGDLPKTYYVSPSGSNTNNGLSLETAWATPFYAAQIAEAGDTILVADGTYSGYVGFGFYVDPVHHGIPEAPITMKAYSGKPEITGGNFIIRANHITIDGFVVHDVKGKAYAVEYTTGIKIFNTEVYNTVGSDGIYIRDSTDVIIDNFYVHDTGWNGIGIKPTTKYPFSGHHFILRNGRVIDTWYHNSFDVQADYLTIENCITDNIPANKPPDAIIGAPFRISAYHSVLNNCSGEHGNNGVKTAETSREFIIINSTFPDYGFNSNTIAGDWGNVILYNNYINNMPYAMYLYLYGNNLIEENEVYSQEINGYTYGFVGDVNANVTIRNEVNSPYTVHASVSGSTNVTVEYTDGRVFSVNGAGEYTTYTWDYGTRTIEVVGWTSVGNISGTVIDAGTGLGMEDATVSVEGTGKSAKTSADGTYTIANVPGGTGYDVTCTAAIYQDAIQSNVGVNEGETATVDFTLTKETILPNIIDHTPTGTDVGIDTDISVTFSEAMNKTSAEDAFSISPPVVGSFNWDGNKMIFAPDSELDHLTTYIVSIGTTVEDLAGNNLASLYSWQFTTKEQDLTPPAISNVAVSIITGSSAIITWTTDEHSTSQIEYGLTSSYGASTTLNANSVTEHSQAMTGLNPNTTYHFRVRSKDADNNEAVSGDYNFATVEETDFVANWKFDEESGEIALDSSGNSNDGTISGASWTDGKFGTALQFDGIDDYISIADSPSLNPTEEITIETWVRPGSLPQVGWNKIVAKPYTSHADPWQQYALTLHDNQFVFELNAGGTKQGVTGAEILTPDTWYHVAGTYDGSEMKIYVNGELSGTLSKSGAIAVYPTDVHIGAGIYSDAQTEYINGIIDEVRILDRALSADEVKADYENSLGDTPNQAPNLDAIGDKSVTTGSPLQFTISASDPDSDPLTYSATNLPTGATFNPTTRVFSWTPDETQAGSYQVHFEVTDGSLSDAEDVTITVNGAAVEVTLTLYEGWNLIALPVINDGFTASSLASAIGDVSYVMKRNASDGGYQDYIVGFSGDADDFVISPDEGYYVYLDVVQKDFTVRGARPGTRSIDLVKGWNLVGWTSLDPSDAVAAFFDPLGGKIKYAAKRNSPYGDYENYVAGFSEPADNFDVEPGYGYFVFVTSDCTWTHD